MGCVQGRVRGGWQRRERGTQECVRRVRKRERLSAQLFSEWPTTLRALLSNQLAFASTLYRFTFLRKAEKPNRAFF